ncbi:family 16 glycosylhydrolase [Sphingomonas sp. dw_22]|uniref:family 16 glycosylhydrolase n=1 Tax=Sphingomonas sp. dw_22 TaxID=2721175 RepID=UPI001BD23F7B|nr:family 16 glycosylhydrolase [Sphingomonas sp. dw_22]
MNPLRKPAVTLRWIFRVAYSLRRLLPKQTVNCFGPRQGHEDCTIGKIYVINLYREPRRWSRVKDELGRIQDRLGDDLRRLTERYAAVDARNFSNGSPEDGEVDPHYTLSDQLFVEPQPRTLPTRFELEAPIAMTAAEVAVARSHIAVWKRVAEGAEEYALVLEDDVWFHPSFARDLDQAWQDLRSADEGAGGVDIVYVSYMEATNGAPKAFLSSHVFKPERGLWYLSGYILSRRGARKLLDALPCRGPVDLWINHQFSRLNVFATKRSIVRQRRDSISTNTYSILPALSGIGAINSEGAALFHARPPGAPVIGFGPPGSGQSSLAMALSMLGYACCSDLRRLPALEWNRLRAGSADRAFGAYVNVGSLTTETEHLRNLYPHAKFVITTRSSGADDPVVRELLARLEGADVALLETGKADAWRVLCEHLRCVPPLSPFPRLDDLGQRDIVEVRSERVLLPVPAKSKWDRSPWIVGPKHDDWAGIQVATEDCGGWVDIDCGEGIDPRRWVARSDTFTGNLALFRDLNVEYDSAEGATLQVRQEDLGVRGYSAGAITSHTDYLFGRFEAVFQASGVPGVVTGFFLHRNSPHQEIDIEIAGNRPNRLLVNVFYNPGEDGARFDYGYRGCPYHIDLGFDASKGLHRYAIEWTPHEIRWLVDGILVHRRVLWNPTPIPHLPMKLHLNAWPSRASQLAGRLKNHRLPATVRVRSINVRGYGPLLPESHPRAESGPDGSIVEAVPA